MHLPVETAYHQYRACHWWVCWVCIWEVYSQLDCQLVTLEHTQRHRVLCQSSPDHRYAVGTTQSIDNLQQESRAVARKSRDAAALLFGLKFADNIHYKFKSSQASKARLHSSKHTSIKQKEKHVIWSQWKGDNGLSNTTPWVIKNKTSHSCP